MATKPQANSLDNGTGLGFPSDSVPDHTGIPFMDGLPLTFPADLGELIAEQLDCKQVIDLAYDENSPLKGNPTVQKVAKNWDNIDPTRANNAKYEIENRRAEAAEARRTAALEAKEKKERRIITTIFTIICAIAEAILIILCAIGTIGLLTVGGIFTIIVMAILGIGIIMGVIAGAVGD